MNPFQKNLDDNELIREATRRGISVDELQAEKSNIPDDSSDIMNKIMAGVGSVPQQAAPIEQPIEKRAPSSEMNPIVKDYLLGKMKSQPIDSEQNQDTPDKRQNVLDQFSPENYQQALQQMKERQSGLGMSQLAAGIGDALARKDSSGTDRYFQDLRNNIQDQTVGEFNRQKASAVNDIKTKQQLDSLDPNSNQSVSFRKIIEANFPQIAKAYGSNWEKVTANDQDLIFKPLQLKEQMDSRKEQMQIHRDMKMQELMRKNLPEERLKNLSGTDKARFDNAMMVLKGIDEMGTALDSGQNTFSIVGDNDYSAASRRATEAYGRMQSGGAINKDEEARFEKTLPSVSDSKELQRKKLIAQREEMISRLKTLGFKPEDLGYQPKDFSYGKGKAEAKPGKTIVKKQFSASRNQTKVIYDDGSEEILDGKQ